VYNLSQHTKTCQGTVLKNQASQVAGLRKGTSKAARRTRAATQVTALPRLLRVDDAGALARLHPKKLWTQPWSVRGWAVPPVITSTDPVASRVGVLKTLRRLIPTERRPRVKVYTSPPGEYEVEPPAFLGVDIPLIDIHAPDFELPLHAYGAVEVDDWEAGRARAEECAPFPDVLRPDLLPVKYSVLFSTGGVVLTTHCDGSGGILVLAEGSAAIGQVILGSQYAHQRGVDAFGLAGAKDAKGCDWRDVAELLHPGDLVSIPNAHPHAVRFGGSRVCVAYFATT
jgi:hypothetical protein